MEIVIHHSDPTMHLSADKTKLEIDITDAQEWVERIASTANEICDDSEGNRIKLNEQNTGIIIESNDAGALGCIGWAIERHMDDIPSKLKPKFKKTLDDTKARKEDLERS
jgi:hypothetical protein